MKKSAAFSHVFFTFAFCFLLFLCAFRYLRLSILFSVLFALAIACCAAALLAAFLGRKRQKYAFSLRAEKEKDALFLFLSLAAPGRALRFLSALYPERFNDVSAPESTKLNSVAPNTPPFVSVCDNLYRVSAKSDAYFSFSSAPFVREKSEALIRSINDVFTRNASRCESSGETSSPDFIAKLYCANVEDDAAALLTRFGVKIITAEDIFARAKETDSFPPEAEELAKEKKVKKFVLRGITKKTSRGLLISAAILLFTSLFSPFPYYYRALGLVLLALSLAVRLLAVKPIFPFRAPPEDKDAIAPEAERKTKEKNNF